MSVLIKGIDKCISCEFCIYAESVPYTPDSRSCIMTGEYTHEKYGYIPNKCPMTGLPEKHGRLIDADAFVEYLENEFKSGYENDQKSDADMKMLITKMHELIITEIRKRPTVVESEE